MAFRSASSSAASKYAASLLFIVERLFVLAELELGRPFLPPFGDLVPSLENEAAREVVLERFG